MRDIRQDLKERIAAEVAGIEPLQEEIKRRQDNIDTLTRLLAQEEGRSGKNSAAKPALVRPSGSLDEYLMKQLSKGPKTFDELRESAKAAGYFEEGATESPGRAVLGKLLNPLRSGIIVRDKDRDRKYHLASKD